MHNISIFIIPTCYTAPQTDHVVLIEIDTFIIISFYIER